MIVPGTYDLGPATASLHLHTTSEGTMARMGHNLTLRVEDWDGVLIVGDGPGNCAVRMSARLNSLRVVDAHGGMKPLSEEDFRRVEKNAARILEVEKHPKLSFASTVVSGDWERGRIAGELAFHGQQLPETFDIERQDDGSYRLSGRISQVRYGLKPYSAMMGALRLGDSVMIKAVVKVGA